MVKLIVLIFLAMLLQARPANAQMGMMGRSGNAIATSSADQREVNLDEGVAEILESQGIGSLNEVNCEEVLESQFEKLGDTWMESVHPGESHDYMERMMGGEGSESLRSAHISMGQRYLGCLSSWKGGRWTGMGMMAPFGGMMGGWGGYGGSMTGLWFFWLVSWVLVNVLLIALIRYFWKKGSNHKS